MSGICGWLGRRAGLDDEAPLRGMADALGRADAVASAVTLAERGPVAVAGPRPRLFQIDDAVLAVDGHPMLDDIAVSADGPAFARRLVAALRDRGAAVLERLNGDFALAFLDLRDGTGLLAVDALGARPLMYAAVDGGVLFGSTLDALAAHPGFRAELDPQALYDYVFFHVVPGPQTIFRQARRLLPGHFLRFDGGVVVDPRPYWRLVFDESRRVPLAELKAGFRDALQQSVASGASHARSGSFLSGGTDSSTVSGLLGQVTGEPAATFSIGFDAAGYDEMEYARIAARHFKTRHHEYYVTPQDVVDAAPRIAAAYDQPFGNASAIPVYYCARLAQQNGIERLLAGDGGDELFGGNDRYAKQQLFAYYDKLPASLRRHLIEPMLRPEGVRRIPLLRKARRYVEQATLPMPRRYEAGNLIEHIGERVIFMPEFLSQVDTDSPHALMRDAHAPFAGCSNINQMLGIDLRFILADGDLPKVTRMCDLAGVDVAFPMLDRRVVDFSTGLAPDLKLRRLQLRWFFKDALRDFLPHEVIVKKKQGFGLPVGAWLTSHPPLTEMARDTLGRLKARGIVQPQFVDDLCDRLLHEHPRYYGTLVWVLMMLGLWLDSRRR